jgi:hypothetical protein
MTERSYKERMERAKAQTHLKVVAAKPSKAIPEDPSPTSIRNVIGPKKPKEQPK